jgi:hypothetical protein
MGSLKQNKNIYSEIWWTSNRFAVMRNSVTHDIELCRTICTESKYRSTCLISWFNFRSRSTYLLWILFQFRKSDRIRFIIIQRLFAHNNINYYRSDLRILYSSKNSVKEISLGLGPGRAELKLNRAGRAQGILGPLFCSPFRALMRARMESRHSCA